MEPLRAVLAELLAYPDVQRHLVGMVTGLDIRYDVGCDHPLAGRRVPGVELVTASGQPGKTSTFEELHAARGVLFDLADSVSLRDAAAGWADRVKVITARPCAGSPLDDVAALLVRPDGYVAWAARPGQEADGLPGALARWFGPPCP
jgi:bifunctional hydroxylase/dehydrase